MKQKVLKQLESELNAHLIKAECKNYIPNYNIKRGRKSQLKLCNWFVDWHKKYQQIAIKLLPYDSYYEKPYRYSVEQLIGWQKIIDRINNENE